MSKSSTLTNKIIDFIYRQGGYVWRASSVGIYDKARGVYRTAPKKGVSDILACYRGRLVAVEVKVGRDRLSPEQDGFLKNIRHAGGIAFVARDFESFTDQWKAQLSTA